MLSDMSASQGATPMETDPQADAIAKQKAKLKEIEDSLYNMAMNPSEVLDHFKLLEDLKKLLVSGEIPEAVEPVIVALQRAQGTFKNNVENVATRHYISIANPKVAFMNILTLNMSNFKIECV